MPTSTRRIRVYELVNKTRLESLLVTTELESAEILSKLRSSPPSEAGFWRPDDDVEAQTLALSVTEPTAYVLIEAYLSQMRLRTWRFRVWRA